MTNFKSWLETFTGTKIIIAIVQPLINDVPTMLYLSTHEFYPNLDNDATKAVKGVIKDEVSLSESISTDYSASISYGDISIANNVGEYDAWLSSSYIWANRPISVYLGALPDPYTSDSVFPTLADFELIFSGVVADVDSRDNTTLSIKIRDNLQRLNTSISESLLGNYNPTSLTNYTNPYSNNLKPLCFGEVHNITPMLTSPALLEYMVHLAEVETILEVRDNGVPVNFTQTGVPAGSFRLLASPKGTITCSVQGAKQTNYISSNTTGYTYTNTAANTIATILRSYGNTVPYTDIDSDSFSNLGQQPIGVYYSDRVNVLSACQELAKGCGLVLSASRTGKLKLKDLGEPKYDSIWLGGYELSVSGIRFSDDGTLMYAVGTTSNTIFQFYLQVPWQVSTAIYQKSFATGLSTVVDILFTQNGNRLLILRSGTTGYIREYTLATPWQINTATYAGGAYTITVDTTPGGLAISQDQTYLYIIGSTSDKIWQLPLAIPGTIMESIGNVEYSLLISAKEGSSTGLTFNNTGTKVHIIGTASDSVHTYNLSIPWRIDTGVFSYSTSISTLDGAPGAVVFDTTGNYMYVAGNGSDKILQFTLQTPWEPNTKKASYSTFVLNNYDTSPTGFCFSSDGLSLYVVGDSTDRIYQFVLTKAYRISTAVYVNSLTISSLDTVPQDIFITPDSTKMFVVGSSADTVKILNFALAAPGDISQASYAGVTTAALDSVPTSVSFSSDGSKMFVLNSGADTITEFSLATPWTLPGTLVNTLSISADEPGANGLAFSADGTKMFVVGIVNDNVITYNLPTPWTISGATVIDKTSIVAFDQTAQCIGFTPDGMYMYIAGFSTDYLYQIPLQTAWTPSSMWPPLITSSDIFYNSLQISEKLPVTAGYKIGYAKNWTIQNNLVTAIPAEHKDLYSSEYLEANATDAYIKNSYSVTTEPQLEQTYLIQESDAIALANKKLNLFKTPRKVFTMRCTAKWLYLEPGDAVRLDLPRFGLSGGVLAQVISTQPNWLANYIDIGVLV